MTQDDAPPEPDDASTGDEAGPDAASEAESEEASSEEAGEDVAAETPAAGRVWLRRLGWAALAVVAVAVPLSVRVAWEGQAELDEAAKAREVGDADLEIEHLGRAARWRMPMFAHDEEALERLVDIGTEAEVQGEDGTGRALSAYREARRAILATRTWGVPHPETFAHVNDRIALLMAQQEERFETDVGQTGDPYSYHLGLLQEVPGPNPWRANLAALAFVGWLVTTAGFVLRSLDARGRLIPRPAVRWGIGSLVLLLIWIIALRYAS